MSGPKLSSFLYQFLTVFLLSLMIQCSKSTPIFNYNICANTTTFTPNSTYQTNLNTLFHSLSSNAKTNPSGFFASAAGNGTNDAVYGTYLCRGDQSVANCSDCVSVATTTDLPKKYCANTKVAIIWYDECMVRYSNQSILGKLAASPGVILANTQNVNGNQTTFSNIVGTTLNDLLGEIENQKSGKKYYGTKKANFTSLETLYTLEQCTPDLSVTDCDRCLRTAFGQLPIKQGAHVMNPSCNVRYETYPFYINAFSISSPPPSSPPPARTVPIAAGGKGKKKVSAKVISAIVIPVVAVSLAVLVLGICLLTKKAKKYDAVAAENGEDFTSAASLQYDLATLQAATNNFSVENKIGEGGFGIVYKGTLADGQEVAVKRLSQLSGQGELEFKNEVLLVAKLQHRNLVRLLGFCLAGEEKLLVYEFVPNKSLDYLLFNDPEHRGILDWGSRYKIICGVARGMLYLHQDSRLRIIHRDLKASNVLLDADMNPKVSDFGMAKLFGVDQTQGNTSRVVGTYGYMSPEYAMHGHFSVKSDVYSFGVLVLEILSGKRNSNFYESGYAEDLLSYAWKHWGEGRPIDFIDSTIRDSCSIHEVMRCTHLGLLCVQESVDQRPTMATVALMLDDNSVTLPTPEQPAFFIKSGEKTMFPAGGESDLSTIRSVPWSVNEASITELDPR